MLKRQLLAFCLDTWTASDDRRPLPHDVRLMLNGLKRNGFPLDFLDVYENQKTDWVARFLEIFGEVISRRNQELLKDYALGVALTNTIRDAIADTEKFEGVTGWITINDEHDAVKSAVVKTVDGGEFKFLAVVEP